MTERQATSGPPDFLRVEEAAAVLRIGRTTAYERAREFLATDGAVGLPAVRVGKQFRVPRCGLERLLGGPITWPIGGGPELVEVPAAAPSAPRSRSTQRPVGDAEQIPLPFSA